MRNRRNAGGIKRKEKTARHKREDDGLTWRTYNGPISYFYYKYGVKNTRSINTGHGWQANTLLREARQVERN